MRSVAGVQTDLTCLEGGAGGVHYGVERASYLSVRRKHHRQVHPGAGRPASLQHGGGGLEAPRAKTGQEELLWRPRARL